MCVSKADAIVLCNGGGKQIGRSQDGDHLVDRANLDLVGLQDELVDAIAATAIPMRYHPSSTSGLEVVVPVDQRTIEFNIDVHVD